MNKLEFQKQLLEAAQSIIAMTPESIAANAQALVDGIKLNDEEIAKRDAYNILLSSTDEKIAQLKTDQADLLAAQTKLGVDQKQLSDDQVALTTGQNQLADDQKQLKADQKTLADDQTQLKTDQDKLADDQAKLATDKTAVSDRETAVAAKENTVAQAAALIKS